MGNVPIDLAAELRPLLNLERAVETGTYQGNGARRLAEVFPSVITIELAQELHQQAAENLADTPAIEARPGDSRQVIPGLVDASIPTLCGSTATGAADPRPAWRTNAPSSARSPRSARAAGVTAS